MNHRTFVKINKEQEFKSKNQKEIVNTRIVSNVYGKAPREVSYSNQTLEDYIIKSKEW